MGGSDLLLELENLDKNHLSNSLSRVFEEYYEGTFREISFSIRRKDGSQVAGDESLELNLLAKDIAFSGVDENDIQYTIHIEGLRLNSQALLMVFICSVSLLFSGCFCFLGKGIKRVRLHRQVRWIVGGRFPGREMLSKEQREGNNSLKGYHRAR